MCAVGTYVKARLEIALEGEEIRLTREQVRELLEGTPPEAGHAPSAEVRVVELTQLLYTPGQLAPVLGVSARTVARWCEAGAFGSPEELKDTAGRWRISAWRVKELLERGMGAADGGEGQTAPEEEATPEGPAVQAEGEGSPGGAAGKAASPKAVVSQPRRSKPTGNGSDGAEPVGDKVSLDGWRRKVG